MPSVCVPRSVEELREYCLACGDIRHEDPVYGTSLHYACIVGDTDLLAAAAVAGLSVDAPTRTGILPLHLAIENEQYEAAGVLVALGADTHSKSLFGETAMHAAASSGSAAAVRAAAGIGLPLDECDLAGVTPLAAAARGGYSKVVDALLALGADPDAALHSLHGKTATERAVLKASIARKEVRAAIYEPRGALSYTNAGFEHPSALVGRNVRASACRPPIYVRPFSVSVK